ncbi:MAG: hypothetical protein ACPGVU_11225 [Limisphaerales bacterium]
MNREKLLMTAAVAVFGLLILDKVVITPLGNLWTERRVEIERLTKDVKKGRNLISLESRLRNTWDDYQQRALPHDRSLAESKVLNAIDDWARSARLKTTRMIPNYRDEDDHSRLACRVEGSGDMEAVMRFLYDLDGELLALRVESFDLGSLDKRGSRISVDITLSGLELPKEKK